MIQIENRCSDVRGVCLCSVSLSFMLSLSFTFNVLYFAFVLSFSSPEFVPFFCSLFLSLWGAEANTTVFLYINSCTLKTIQLLTKMNLCGLVFSFRVDLQSLTKGSLLKHKCLFASSVLFHPFLPLRCSVSYFEPRRHSDRYGRLFHSCSDDTVTVHEPSTLH